ncbi:MAG: alkaline phosphatase family protein [Candidatus Angelobacter sp.]
MPPIAITGVEPGQRFLADLYRILISNPKKWSKTMLVVTYDEHGGFFDHVLPLNIPATINGIEFQTTGVRVPAFLISPHVKPGIPFSGALDHTSILQLLDDRFVKGEGYSVAVNERQKHLDRILNAISEKPQFSGPPELELKPLITTAAQAIKKSELITTPSAPPTANAAAFHETANKVAEEHPQLLKSPGWEKLDAYLARPVTSKAS